MLWIRGLLFTFLVPGVLGGYVPYVIYEGQRWTTGKWSGGWILVGAGAAIYLDCLIAFLLSGGTPAIFFSRRLRFMLGEEPSTLVRQGMYRVSRNPMYLGVTIAVFGQAIVFASQAVVLYGIALWGCFHIAVVFGEEPHLRRERGQSYDEYCQRVPRWLGLPR
jgi:protein-S-isoprenylcysteine O-methyltransferase Ste14